MTALRAGRARGTRHRVRPPSAATSTTTSSSRYAGLAPPCPLGADGAGAADPGHQQPTAPSSTASAIKDAVPASENDVVTIANVDMVVADGTSGPPHRARRRVRWPRRPRRQLDHRWQSHTAGPCFVLGQARHADGGDRPVGIGQVHPFECDRAAATQPRRRSGDRSTGTTSTPSTHRCATESAWCPRTTSCIGS